MALGSMKVIFNLPLSIFIDPMYYLVKPYYLWALSSHLTVFLNSFAFNKIPQSISRCSEPILDTHALQIDCLPVSYVCWRLALASHCTSLHECRNVLLLHSHIVASVTSPSNFVARLLFRHIRSHIDLYAYF